MEQVENPMVRPIKDVPLRVVSFCVQCNVKLFADEEFLVLDGEHFCDTQCLKDYLGVKRIEGWELNEK
ncbi:hypothetical protein ACQ3VF_26365 [Bacillus toyonensis]|uniref:hypothetical protein n=1 Tax=Bacillus toyonensis TaxID=155322 RepID=UPI003D301920